LASLEVYDVISDPLAARFPRCRRYEKGPRFTLGERLARKGWMVEPAAMQTENAVGHSSLREPFAQAGDDAVDV
jgi:hypothetical protein